MKIKTYILLLIFINVFYNLNAFFGGMCGSGGGSSCCSSGGGNFGGGCGRKKRSLLETPLKNETSNICPQESWKNIITQNLQTTDITSSEYAIYSSMIHEYGNAKVFVTCFDRTLDNTSNLIPKLIKFVSNGEAYCSHGDDNLWCTVLALLG